MDAALRRTIETANNRVKRSNQQQFVKRSSDAQMLDHVLTEARGAVDAYNRDRDYVGIREAMKRLETAVVLAERRKR